MTFKEKWRHRRETKIATEKMKAKKKQIHTFIEWYKGEIKDNRDKDVNYVWIGYQAYHHFWGLVQKYPELTLLSEVSIDCPAGERLYKWEDGKTWYAWTKKQMDRCYIDFLAREVKGKLYGDYTLVETGPLGDGSPPYKKNAYLSYAYHEAVNWRMTIKNLEHFLAE